LVYHIEHALISTIGSIENLALSVKDELLEIEGHSLSNAEVLCILGNAHLHFFAGAEEMINGISAGEDHSSVIGYLHFLLTKLPRRNTFQPNEWLKIQGYIILPRKLKVRRLIAFRTWLGNQDFFHAHGGRFTFTAFTQC